MKVFPLFQSLLCFFIRVTSFGQGQQYVGTRIVLSLLAPCPSILEARCGDGGRAASDLCSFPAFVSTCMTPGGFVRWITQKGSSAHTVFISRASHMRHPALNARERHELHPCWRLPFARLVCNPAFCKPVRAAGSGDGEH